MASPCLLPVQYHALDQLRELRDEARLALLEVRDDAARQGVHEVLELIQSLMADTSQVTH
jgi:hypothetical protein